VGLLRNRFVKQSANYLKLNLVTMKKITLSLSICFFATLFSCKKDKNTSNGGSVEDITATVQKVSTPVAPKQHYSGYSSWSWFSLVGDNIFYSCASNLGTGNPQFMLRYNLSANSFSTVTPDKEICACGYTNKMVTDGTNIFYIANDAVKYTVSGNAWSKLSYPSTAKDNNGETGQVYYNNKIYVLGGRNASTRFKYYDIAANTWYNAADYGTSVSTSQMAVVNNKIYALGYNDANKKSFSSYDAAANSWNKLTDLPFDISSSYKDHFVSSYQNRFLLVLQGKKLYIYDAVKAAWKTAALDIPIADISTAANLFSSGTKIYVAGVSGARDFVLYTISLDKVPE
jgi:hypothetical protein